MTNTAAIQSSPIVNGFRRSEHFERLYIWTKPVMSAAIDTPTSHGRRGARTLAAPAAPAAASNVPTGRQQLTAAVRLPSAAIEESTGPRSPAIGRFLHT